MRDFQLVIEVKDKLLTVSLEEPDERKGLKLVAAPGEDDEDDVDDESDFSEELEGSTANLKKSLSHANAMLGVEQRERARLEGEVLRLQQLIIHATGALGVALQGLPPLYPSTVQCDNVHKLLRKEKYVEGNSLT
jgi:hypothetical protein